MGGETNVVSVLEVLYPLQRVSKTDYRSEPIGYLTPYVVDIICPFIVETSHVVISGRLMDSHKHRP
jgi:hypothetical protein